MVDDRTRKEQLLLVEKGRERKREMWMWFAGLMICVVALTVAVALLFEYVNNRNVQENITTREKFEACQSIETETARVVCVNGWGK